MPAEHQKDREGAQEIETGRASNGHCWLTVNLAEQWDCHLLFARYVRALVRRSRQLLQYPARSSVY
jgi:hypothetical protein